ncbi:hypothetical protein HII36_37520 [Nonomuraea sp. NN258]|uniref:hypothetical protein n=1 Tax=Nonomuraea antri TaxID=2730852 RepID=UPI00156A1A0A|nr:hypothetical protein [Nonomuraea antri]NRQ37491.1 hypothetical protein [Nonomuraea antri]
MITEPPGRPFLVIASAVTLLVFFWASYPFWHLESLLLTIFAGWVLWVYWLFRLGLAALNVSIAARLWRWLLPGFLAVAALLVLVTDAPFRVRFAVSKPSLEAYVKTVAENPERAHPCQWAGSYYACRPRPYSEEGPARNSVWFQVQDPLFGDDGGFLWMPSGEPVETMEERFRHLGGPWYGTVFTSSG